LRLAIAKTTREIVVDRLRVDGQNGSDRQQRRKRQEIEYDNRPPLHGAESGESGQKCVARMIERFVAADPPRERLRPHDP
jgi:hypothetical protein